MNDMIRILIADDHPIVREGWASIIRRRTDMSIVGEVTDGEEAIHIYKQERPDLVLMDLRMPHIDGLEAIRQIRQFDKDARIIVLTTFDGDENIYQALKAGAMAYLLKDTSRDILIDTIRAVNSGQRVVPPNVAAQLAEHMLIDELTDRERQVLELIAAGHSNQDISVTLHISEGTVKAHTSSIFSKLRVSDRTQAVIKAVQRGLIRLD